MKKPAARGGFLATVTAAQPGNRPGRGKSAHGKPPPGKKPPPKPAPGFVRQAVQAKQAQAAAAKKKAAAKKAKHHPRRQLALGEGVACCSAEALAASLRLAGYSVTDDDVLELYWRTAADEDAGASILATLEAASRFGLAGVRPAGVGAWRRLVLKPQPSCHPPYAEAHITQLWPASTFRGPALIPDGGLLPAQMILGVGLPGPHAVFATADGWWSWGELYEPWTDDIDEAWEVTWPGTR